MRHQFPYFLKCGDHPSVLKIWSFILYINLHYLNFVYKLKNDSFGQEPSEDILKADYTFKNLLQYNPFLTVIKIDNDRCF